MKNILNKKGSIHIDWVISMGLFLIYVVVLFILIKPGYYAEHNPESLFNIIETNFAKSININIKEVQFVVEECKDSTIILSDINDKYSFSKLTQKGVEVKEKGVNIGSDLKITCNKNTNDPNYHIINKQEVFIATSYPRDKPFDPEISISEYKLDCNQGEGNAKCVASLGVIGDYDGFNEEYLDELLKIDYITLKNNWDFPLGKEFSISVTKLKDNNIKVINKNKPPQNIDVFVKEFNWIYIDKSNNRENIKVHMDIW